MYGVLLIRAVRGVGGEEELTKVDEGTMKEKFNSGKLRDDPFIHDTFTFK